MLLSVLLLFLHGHCTATLSSGLHVLAKGTSPALPDLYEASVLELQAGLDAGHFTSVDLVKVNFAAQCYKDSSAILTTVGIFRAHQ
jgi:hypothetical protein